ncbi:MAG TPA: hypothetical protein VI384_07290 [Candidatus Dormibacteraeota bacterium]
MIGPWLLAASGVVILVEVLVLAIWTRRLAKGGQALAVMVTTQRGLVQADLQRLQATLEETRRLWVPYRRALRWLRHPLVAALMASFWRRWRAA